MKRILVAALCVLAFGFTANAQEKDSVSVYRKGKPRFYIGLGVAVTDYDFNKKLANSSLPEINEGVFELSLGVTNMNDHFVSDLEWNTDYYGDKKTTGERVRTLSTGIKWRPQYIIFKKGGSFFSAGLDLSYVYNTVNIFTRGNTIDLDNLNPATHTGHISLYNNNIYLGPSASFGILSNKEDSFRITTGYEWNIARASWKSEYADVLNTVKENGQGRFYIKLIWVQ